MMTEIINLKNKCLCTYHCNDPMHLNARNATLVQTQENCLSSLPFMTLYLRKYLCQVNAIAHRMAKTPQTFMNVTKMLLSLKCCTIHYFCWHYYINLVRSSLRHGAHEILHIAKQILHLLFFFPPVSNLTYCLTKNTCFNRSPQ